MNFYKELVQSGDQKAYRNRLLFRMFDKDQDCFINKEEFKELAKNLLSDRTDAQLEEEFEKYDLDKDGKLTFEGKVNQLQLQIPE